MAIWLDPRDGSGDLLSYFTTGTAQLAALESADVMGVGNGPEGKIMWGIEVKKVGDVIGSMQNGRLAEQLGKMYEDYDLKFLLVEGQFAMNEETGVLRHRVKKTNANGKEYEFWCDAYFGRKRKMDYSHFMAWLMSLCLCSGTFYLHTTCREETAMLIESLEDLLNKPWEGHSSLKVFNDASGPGLYIPSTAMKVARQLAFGLGWEKAAKAADHFKTVKAMVNATEQEWMEVDGVDKVLAQRAVEGATEPHVLRIRKKRGKK